MLLATMRVHQRKPLWCGEEGELDPWLEAGGRAEAFRNQGNASSAMFWNMFTSGMEEPHRLMHGKVVGTSHRGCPQTSWSPRSSKREPSSSSTWQTNLSKPRIIGGNPGVLTTGCGEDPRTNLMGIDQKNKKQKLCCPVDPRTSGISWSWTSRNWKHWWWATNWS